MDRRGAQRAIRQAERFLLTRQSPDGAWRDFALPPGRSEAWTTACVAWALARTSPEAPPLGALQRAADLLHSLRGPRGWGYNRHTAPDADSTAWACRLLATLDDRRGADLVLLLTGFLSEEGAAHTFRGSARFGTWAQPHADVTALVGSALVVAGAPAATIDAVRAASLRACRADGWVAFWWSAPAYATARNVEFLALSGGCPPEIASAVDHRLEPAAGSTIEAAHKLLVAALGPVRDAERTGRLGQDLLARQADDGGWPASAELLVPSQHGAESATAYADDQRLLSTAMAVDAAKVWLAAAYS